MGLLASTSGPGEEFRPNAGQRPQLTPQSRDPVFSLDCVTSGSWRGLPKSDAEFLIL